ncbi:MAG: hypothetical protein JKY56_20325 [Kofleriaceae bacterium]|nr:hypothetical protein [Kofleriaceae bacterium]
MSRRRGGPPDLKSTLGSLLRTTLDQFGAVKDVVEQQTRGRGGLLDQALMQRRRKEAMARLGESMYSYLQKGSPEAEAIALVPEIAMAIANVDSLEDEEYGYDSPGFEGGEFVPASDHNFVPAPNHSSPKQNREAVSSANYRPPAPKQSSKEFRVWRPVVPPDDDSSESEDEPVSLPMSASSEKDTQSRIPRKTAQRKRGGGIHFVDEPARPGELDSDDDLESYMHDDDV